MKTICVSGGFDPLTVGHVSLIEEAKLYGKVVVILNSDDWLLRKKGYHFMPYSDRYRILMALSDVGQVIPVNDIDGTVCTALRAFKPDYFANGGDRTLNNTPELDVCRELGITPVFNIGGGKISSSSELVKRVANV